MRPLLYILNQHKVSSAAYRQAVKTVTTHHCGPSTAIRDYYEARRNESNKLPK